MIVLSMLTERAKGREVIYRSSFGDKVERGVISSWNDKFIFVRYERYGYVRSKELPRYQETAAATSPEDLTFA